MAWTIDGGHSEVQFSVKHMMISTVRGRFDRFSGTIDADEQNPTTAYMTGKLKIEGDMSNAMQLQGVLAKLKG